jgi:nucleoside-diphosphate-sugar epimerase
VANAVEAACLAAARPAASGQTYIVTDGRPYSSRELYELICKGLGRAIPGWNVPLPVLRGLARAGDVIGRVRRRRFFFDSDALEKLIGSAWYSSEKISRELGYRPSVTFEEALPELVAWYRAADGSRIAGLRRS